MQERLNWIKSVKNKLPEFLKSMKLERSGQYKFSYVGDFYSSEIVWGLGQTVFASKLYYILNNKHLLEDNKNALAEFILLFSNSNGQIHDPLIQRLNRLSRIKKFFFNKDTRNLFNSMTRRAETRQAFAALECLGKIPPKNNLEISFNNKFFEDYINSLDWNKPYASGSHFGHLLYFLSIEKKYFNMKEEEFSYLLDISLNQLSRYLQEDGFWYFSDNPGLTQKINGSMKIITGLDAVNKIEDNIAVERLIDGCLEFFDTNGACNNFDVIYTLSKCKKISSYRNKEVINFAYSHLDLFKNHYFPELGGFSFFPKNPNSHYYGAKINKSLEGPDMQGTLLYMWGIVLICYMIDSDFNFKEPIT